MEVEFSWLRLGGGPIHPGLDRIEAHGLNRIEVFAPAFGAARIDLFEHGSARQSSAVPDGDRKERCRLIGSGYTRSENANAERQAEKCAESADGPHKYSPEKRSSRGADEERGIRQLERQPAERDRLAHHPDGVREHRGAEAAEIAEPEQREREDAVRPSRV